MFVPPGHLSTLYSSAWAALVFYDFISCKPVVGKRFKLLYILCMNIGVYLLYVYTAIKFCPSAMCCATEAQVEIPDDQC